MKEEKISEIISGIDENFIDEAARIKRSKPKIIRYGILAACVSAAVFAVVLTGSQLFPSFNIISLPEGGNGRPESGESITENKIIGQESITEPAIETPAGEMMIMPQWDDLSLSMKYPEAELNGITYSSQAKEIPEENVLSFLGSCEMQGYDIYTDTTYKAAAEIYSIKNISANCAVAVKIEGGEEYYVYINPWYSPATLGDFISDLDLMNTVAFRKAFIDKYEFSDHGSAHTQRIYSDFDDSIIWRLLSDVYDAENVEYNKPYDRIGIETDLPVLGYKNISFCLTPDGYIITNILSTQKCFFVGEEKFVEFDSYLKENVPFKEYNNVYENNPDGSIPGKGGEGQSTPGYNPQEGNSVPPYSPDGNISPSPDIIEEETVQHTN